MRITLVRHPQTTANEKKIIYGRLDYPYTLKGLEQVGWLKKYFKDIFNCACSREGDLHQPQKQLLLSSPSIRAYKLAFEIGKVIRCDCKIDERIGEMNFGVFEGLTLSEAKESYPKDYDNFQNHFQDTAIPEGESYKEFSARVDEIFNEIIRMKENHAHDEVVMVTHGAIIRELTERLLRLNPGESWKLIMGNGCIVRFDVIGNDYCLKELIATPF